MKRKYRNSSKRRLMDKIDHELDRRSTLLQKTDYLLSGIAYEWIINDLSWVPSKKQYKIGLFRRIHPRV